MAVLDEKTYRHLVDDTFAGIDRAFADVDPDRAEVDLDQGALTITFAGGLRCMLTPQPPVRQLWMAFRDRAWHFDWDESAGAWLDDRGQGLEMRKLVADITRETAGVAIEAPAAR